MAVCYDGGDEPSGSITRGEFFDKLRTFKLLRKDSAPLNYSAINGQYAVALQSHFCSRYPMIANILLMFYLCV
jgi:hypothetical protein